MLQNRLELCLQNKLQAETSLQKMQDYAAKLQEDLQTTTQNYETQLSIMSEHLANMNDKLTIQRDEIDQLKYQMTNKVSLYIHYQLSTGIGYHGIPRMLVACCLGIRVCFPYNLEHHVHSVQQKSIGLIFLTSPSGSHMKYSCHHNSLPFIFPMSVHS